MTSLPRWSTAAVRADLARNHAPNHSGDCDIRPRRFRPGCPLCQALRVARDEYDLRIARETASRAKRVHTKYLIASAIDRWEELDLWACVFCGAPFEQVDHIVAVAHGGTDAPANLQPACQECNGSKHDQGVEEWLSSPRQIERLGDLMAPFRAPNANTAQQHLWVSRGKCSPFPTKY